MSDNDTGSTHVLLLPAITSVTLFIVGAGFLGVTALAASSHLSGNPNAPVWTVMFFGGMAAWVVWEAAKARRLRVVVNPEGIETRDGERARVSLGWGEVETISHRHNKNGGEFVVEGGGRKLVIACAMTNIEQFSQLTLDMAKDRVSDSGTLDYLQMYAESAKISGSA